MNKYFVWYDSSRPGRPCTGPFYFDEVEKIGKKICHSLDDMLKMNLSDSMRRKLEGAKLGTSIKMHRLHSTGDMMVRCVDESKLPAVDDYSFTASELRSIEEKEKKLKRELELLGSKIFLIKKD